MDAQLWRRARALFDELADTPAALWEARLAEACPDDAAVRAEALALLRADSTLSADTRLVAAVPLVMAHIAERIDSEDSAQSSGDRAGLRLGAFQLVREIGRGGMGAVWLGERVDGGFSQQVAIKLIRSGWDTPEVHARFRAERQILASLQHPNIAHLIDGDITPDGKPWLALEYVDGIDLREYCDQARLGIPQRLDLFMNACAAVGHAHQRLVVHRDLKPSNILVSRDGLVKLLDFGIAKLLDAPAGGITATRLFTPEYAAPEQIRGEPITTAVDIYALGLLLYELLTGRRPYRVASDSPSAWERAAIEQAPTRPSSAVTRDDGSGLAVRHAERRALSPRRLRSRLRGDLDAIVLKALRAEPEQRYASVAEFCADLQRHLHDRPVHARRGNWRYRAGRFLRRHRWAMSVTALAALALAAGLGAALWQAREARLQRDTAEQALGFMTTLFRNADPGANARADLRARDLLDQGARDVRHALADQDGARARMLIAIASAYIDLALPDPAGPLLDEAMALAEAAGDPTMLAEVLVQRCGALIYRDREDSCTPLLDRVETLLDPNNSLHAPTLANALYLRMRPLLHGNRHEEIVALANRALALLGNVREQRDLRAEISATQSFSLVKLGRAAEAEALMRPLVDELLADAGTAPRTLTDAQDTLAGALFAQGRNDEGLALREASVAKLESIYGNRHPLLADNLINLGIAYYRVGNLARARASLARASGIARAAGTAHASALVSALGTLGTIEFHLGAYRDARAHLDEAIAIADKVGQPLDAGRSLRWRAIVSLVEGRDADAAADLDHSLERLVPLHARDHVAILHTRTLRLAADFAGHGPDARTPGRCEELADLDRRFTAVSGVDDPDARMAHLLDRLCAAEGSTSDALREFDQALAPDDYRRHLARRLAAAWQDASAPVPVTAPASR